LLSLTKSQERQEFSGAERISFTRRILLNNLALWFFFLENLPFETGDFGSFEPGVRRKACLQAGMAQKLDRIHIVLRGDLRKQQSLTVALLYDKAMLSDLYMLRKFFGRSINLFRWGKNCYLNN
jgi:hypothetical protein